MSRIVSVLAAVLAAIAVQAPAVAGDLLSELQACRSQSDSARLACFDRVLARHDTVPAAPVAAAPVPATMSAAAPAAATTPSFGSERLPQSDQPRQDETMTAKIASVRYNAFQHFTVTLDNGQVWRQAESDTPTIQFKTADTVKISRGFLNSYSLSVDGMWGTYNVKRIK